MRGILLVQPFDADTRFVDRVTGRLGFGHAAILNGERDDEGNWLGIDASIDAGNISKRPLIRITRGAGIALVFLGDSVCDHMYRAAEERIGQPYNSRGLLGLHRPGKAATCSQLVYECLPEHIRSGVKCWRSSWCTPNCLAKTFLRRSTQWDFSSSSSH